ncbi:MAG: DNA polymerase III subunit beta, partial [Gammaproteobacteria bacterium]
LVATDGHRLALCRMDDVAMEGEAQQAIVPRKAILELLRLLDEGEDPVEFTVNPHHIQFSMGPIVFTSKLIDGRFPDYERVIPETGNRVMVAERDALRQALARCAILTTEQNRAVRFHLTPGLLKLSTQNPEEEAEEELPVDYQGGEMEIGFNVVYLLDALNAMTEDKVEMHLTSPDSGCLLKAHGQEACLYVVMPMRL